MPPGGIWQRPRRLLCFEGQSGPENACISFQNIFRQLWKGGGFWQFLTALGHVQPFWNCWYLPKSSTFQEQQPPFFCFCISSLICFWKCHRIRQSSAKFEKAMIRKNTTPSASSIPPAGHSYGIWDLADNVHAGPLCTPPRHLKTRQVQISGL